ncbi:ABC transporter ATP-binding protein [Microbacterium sp.]|uniref:ABC transporter ATP-binding protein n=1 Tax=Microbacterium sp. TaxID=51671 RepID=UPI002810FAC5|nr:ABC transporter ATP-binding protein [Microbacterium sp.]
MTLPPATAPASTVDALTVEDLSVRFTVGHRGPLFRRRPLVLSAVDDVRLSLPRGSSLGIVGESGSGKSTLARAIAGLAEPTEGSIRLEGAPLTARRNRRTSRRVQMVFQDPASSLNPRRTIRSMLRELLVVHDMVPGEAVEARVRELVGMVELPVSVLDSRPRGLSGGQRQRLGIARALALRPEILLLDEPLAALDVSVQASVMLLLRRLQAEIGFSMIFISHDLGAVRGLCSDVAVMYLGRIVEYGPVDHVLREPLHPYTWALIAAEPSIDDPRPPGSSGLTGEVPSPISPPSGCTFRTRCPWAEEGCAIMRPELRTVSGHVPGHPVACFVADRSLAPPVPPRHPEEF